MIRVFISAYKPVNEPNEKLYYVYIIEIINNGRCHRIERRYSNFLVLHKQLRKTHQTPEFPPKRVIHNTVKVLEVRRAGLEAYLRELLLIEPPPRPLLAFLGVQPQPSLTEIECEEPTHQPMLSFQPSLYLDSSDSSGSCSDIVIKGVLQGLYGQ